jgi:hypothetical protein
MSHSGQRDGRAQISPRYGESLTRFTQYSLYLTLRPICTARGRRLDPRARRPTPKVRFLHIFEDSRTWWVGRGGGTYARGNAFQLQDSNLTG